VTIVGRPNVGKSALFNRLVKKRQAIVRDTPLGHVTRDYQEGRAILGDLKFLAIDTSGLEPYLPGDSIQGRATMITRQVLQRADVVLFLLDGKYGILPADISVAQWFREFGDEVVDKILLVANKCERGSKGTPAEFMISDAEKLGYGETVAISAETGEGMVDLYASLAPKLDPLILERSSLIRSLGSLDTDDEKNNLSHPKVAIMGLTNVVRFSTKNRFNSSLLF
jgi:small GTP-binding protein